ncbi:MAG TPA: glycosyltransferase [Marmoricola sp.]
MSTDLTVIVTVHDETLVCGPTMRSAEAAIGAAEQQGHTVQRVISLDRATPATTDFFAQSRFDGWERKVMDEGDLGRVRNALLPDTEGEFVAFLDADDLFSENWLAASLARLRAGKEEGRRQIAHPEVNVVFDADRSVLVNRDQSSPLFTPYYFYVRNYYDALVVAPREAHLEVPYGSNDLSEGVGFEDWQFALESMDAGWEHIVVPDTIIFKRRRDTSLVVESSSRKTVVRPVAALAIDAVADLNHR